MSSHQENLLNPSRLLSNQHHLSILYITKVVSSRLHPSGLHLFCTQPPREPLCVPCQYFTTQNPEITVRFPGMPPPAPPHLSRFISRQSPPPSPPKACSHLAFAGPASLKRGNACPLPARLTASGLCPITTSSDGLLHATQLSRRRPQLCSLTLQPLLLLLCVHLHTVTHPRLSKLS